MNRHNLCFASILSLLATTSGAADAPDAPQRVFAQVAPSMVTIQTLDEKGQPETQGSGVVIGRELVATNCHVVQEAATVRVRSAQGELPALWTRQLPAQDLCLLTVTGLTATPVKLRPSSTLAVGEPVFAVGNPLGFGLAVSAGLVAVVKAQTPYPMVVATPSVSHGSSGGGLFDGQGQLLGITAAVLGTGQNLNLVLPADAVAALMTGGSPRPAASAVPAPEKRWDGIAESLKASGDIVGLEKHSRAWSQAQPSAALPLVYLGLTQRLHNRDTEAEATLRQALARDDNLPFAWLNLASVLFSLQQPEQAEQALQQAQHVNPIYDEPSRKRAEWLQQEGKNAEALVQIKEALRLEPSRSYSWTLLGKIEGSLGHGPAASRALATALRLDGANASSGSQSVEALVAIGFAELKQNHFGPAEDAMRKAIAQAPSSSAAWNGLGAVLAKTQRNTQADEAFTQSLTLEPNDAGVLSNRAGVRLNLHHNELARADAQRAIEIAPQYADAWSVYGRIQLTLKNYREASTAFEKLATFAPLNAVDLTLWGESQLGMGDIAAARANLQKAEALDPNLTNMHLVTAKLLGNNGDVPGALIHLNRALATNPSDPVAWSSKGYALLKLGKPPEAAEALETAVSLDPALANAWINLGEAQMRNRNLARAIQALEKAVVLAPAAMDARMYLAQSYLGARLPSKSREQTEKLLAARADFTPGLGLLTMSYLMEGNVSAATKPYLQLKTLAPAVARQLREQAMAGGLVAAIGLPE